MKNFKEIIGKEMIIFDGGLGSVLQARGMKVGIQSIEMNLLNPELISQIQCEYINSGAMVLSLNSFGADSIHLANSKYSEEEIINAAIVNARKAIEMSGKDAYIFYDIGPTGKLLKPLGDLDFDDAYEVFAKQVRTIGDRVDGFIIETMSDLYEMKAAILAVKENSSLPVISSVTFSENRKMLTGAGAIQTVATLEALGVDMLGINCSLGPKELMPIVEEVLSCAHTPLLVQPNAGLPKFDGEKTYYEIDPETYASYIEEMAELGISGFGGCCGTTPEHIFAAKRRLSDRKPKFKAAPISTIVTGTTTFVEIGKRVMRCGERLNPTGKPKMKAAITEGRYYDIVSEGIKQVEAGADVLDVNVGVPNIDETLVMTELMTQLQEVIDVPLQIDSSNPQVLEKACRRYNGIPLINSVNGKQETMDSVFPTVAKYGGVVIGLCIDENGIPPTAQERFEIAKRIVSEACKYNIAPNRIIIDSLVLTASAQQKEVIETVKCVKLVTDELHCATALGLSNVSFGLPNRPLINKTFLVMAMHAGLKLPILNPLDRELMSAIDAFEVLNASDENASDYIDRHKDDVVSKPGAVSTSATDGKTSASISSTGDVITQKDGSPLYNAIVSGQKHLAVEAVKQMTDMKPLDIVAEHLIPALDKVGSDYDKGKIFLPQLMVSAETAKLVFDEIKSSLKADNNAEKKGPIVIATVEADVHDIGKNIVKVVLQSYGFDVIDLGKDVKASVIVEEVKRSKPLAVGLSALMTTTVVYMQKTVEALRKENLNVPVIVGGAVVTQEVCDNIGADYYGNDAMETVRIAEKLQLDKNKNV